MRKKERVIKTRANWKKESQVKKIKTIMTAVAVALCISVAAGAVLAWMEIKRPFDNASSSEQPASSQAPQALPVYDNAYNLLIVSPTKEIPEDFEVRLVDIDGIQIDERILPYLEQMQQAAKEAGVSLRPARGYISQERQDVLYQELVDRLISEGVTRVSAEERAQTTFGRGGFSEYQTGMAIDFAAGADGEAAFESTQEFQWLQTNSVQYGFILRYPKNKQNRTGMQYNPSHFRFVGVENAKKMRQYSMCLEEYVSYLKAQETS